MIIFTIGNDQKVLEKGGRVYERVKEYSTLCDKYFVFVFTKTPPNPPLNNGGNMRIEDGNFVVVPVLHKSKLLAFWSLYKAIKRELSLPPCDARGGEIVLSSQDPFEMGLLAFLISKFLNLHLHVQVHTDISSKYFRRESLRNYFQFLLSKFVLKRARAIRVVSRRIKNFLEKDLKISNEKIFEAPIFSDFTFSPNTQTTKNNTILFVGRIEKVKNLPLLIKSFKKVQKQKEFREYRLKIIGDGKMKKVWMQRFAKVKNIIWENFRTDIHGEFATAKLSVIPSYYEGWALTAVESVASGTPVLMTPVGCAGEFIFDNLNGFVSKGFRKREFTKRLEEALLNLGNIKAENLESSMKMLQSKENYFKTLKASWEKSLV